MPPFHYSFDNDVQLIATRDRYAEAGIDPAFDAELDELERQFAEIRLSCNHH